MKPKFRAWLKEENEMIIVDTMNWFDDEFESIGDGITFLRGADKVELMQSTGLKDKTGKEIFEGDIVKRYRNPLFKAKWEYQIETVVKREACLLLEKKFGRNSATMSFGSPFTKSDLLEVVGNIYENPELLEV